MDPATPRQPQFRPTPPLTLGILGGIAAGKSTVAGLFRARGLCWIDADRAARGVTESPAILTELCRHFGSSVCRADGSLDRRALATRVFADPEARQQLEAITHPPIRQAVLAKLEAALARGDSVLLDAPLLLETGLIDQCSDCVFVDADLQTRRARAATRGWDEGELERREANQARLSVKKGRCRFTICTAGALETTRRAVDQVLKELEADRDPDRSN